MMRVFVAGKVGDDSETIAGVIEQIEALGCKITYDWTKNDEVTKPYLDHAYSNRPHAKSMLYGAKEADYFVLYYHPLLLGALIELGAFLGTCFTGTQQWFGQVIIVCDDSDMRQSLYYCFDNVTIVDSTEAMLQKIKRLLQY